MAKTAIAHSPLKRRTLSWTPSTTVGGFVNWKPGCSVLVYPLCGQSLLLDEVLSNIMASLIFALAMSSYMQDKRPIHSPVVEFACDACAPNRDRRSVAERLVRRSGDLRFERRLDLPSRAFVMFPLRLT